MSKTVATRSDASAAMLAATAKGRALMGGTAAMRRAGRKFLPQFESESEAAYNARRDSSWLFNGYRKTVRDMTGRVFDRPVQIVEGPPAMQEWAQDIDLAGRDLSTFARSVFEDALSGPGLSWVMVDAPRRDGVVTRAQAQARNLRPYLVHLSIEDVIGWRVGVIDSVPVLTQLRIMEHVIEPDPTDEFGEVKVDQVRAMDLEGPGGGVRVRVWRKPEMSDAWVVVDEFATGLGEITVAPFYAQRMGFWHSEPVLDDLADVNVAHWQSQSDQRNILHFARVPILFAAGHDPEDGQLTISAGMATATRDPAATLRWVEHSGAAIAAGRQDLKDLEFQMETHGLQMLVQRGGGQSATGEALDAAKETSHLAMMADSLRDTLERALSWALDYAGAGGVDVEVDVNDDFGADVMGAQEVAVLLQAVQTGNLSRETFLREMARRGMVRADLDVEEEAERIAATAPALEGEPLDLNDGA